MQVIVYDCTDHLNPKWRGCTLRVVDDAGVLVLQGQVYGNARELGKRIAAGFGVELKYVGPPSSVLAAGDAVEVPPLLEAQAVVVHVPAALATSGRNDGWLF